VKIIVTAVAAALLLAAPATANPDSDQAFINDAHAAGYTQNDQDLLRDGYIVCAVHQQSGADNDLIGRGIAAAQRFLGHAADPAADQKFVVLAIEHLCPEAAPQ
jgi:hypothetical protein